MGCLGFRSVSSAFASASFAQLRSLPCLSFIYETGKQNVYFCFPVMGVGFDLFSRLVAKQVFSALQSLTSVFGMGTGGPSALEKPTSSKRLLRLLNCVSIDLSFRTVASQVLSALQSLTSVFGMGTGGPSALKTLTFWCTFRDSNPGPTD